MFLTNITAEDSKSFGTSLLEAVLGWAGASAFVLVTLEYIMQLASNSRYENTKTTPATVVAIVGLLSLVDGYVHYKVYSHKRYDKQHDHHSYDNHDQKTLATTTTPLLEPTLQDKFSYAAFFCALSCSIELVGVPTAVAALMRTMNILGELNQTQKIIELSLSSLTIGFCIWAGSRRYALAKNHLEHGRQHTCC